MKRLLLACLVAAGCGPALATVWVVEGSLPAASDSNDGQAARPLRTLGEAMRRLAPGDEVVVGDGIYRETVVVPVLPPQPGRTTVIRARNPGASIVRGSDLVTGWQPVAGGRYVVDWRGRAEPAQVFVGGRPLRQVGGTVFGGYPDLPGHELAPAHRSEGGIWPGRVAGQAASLKAGDFTFDGGAQTLVWRPADGMAPAQGVEVAARGFVFLAENVHGLRVQGLVFEHANTSHTARQGAVKVFGSDNVVSGVVIRHMDAVGLQLFGERSQLLDSTIEDCGQLGLNARGRQLTIAGNRILRNNTRGFNKWWEAGGIKIIGDSGLHDAVIRDNVVAFNRGDGIWIDWMNTGIRISHNVAAFNEGFGIQYEASQTGWIDDNAAYGNGLRGIYVLESSDTRVERNVVLANGLEGLAVADGERSAADPRLKPRRNRLSGNVVGWNRNVELMLPPLDLDNGSDHNLLIAAGAPGVVAGWPSLRNLPARGLADWRGRSRLDTHSTERHAPLPPALALALQERRLLGVEQLRAIADPYAARP